MAILRLQFTQALQNVEVRGAKAARAVKAHVQIRARLEVDSQLLAWGIDTVLIGSYKRHTGIHPGKDVDVFGRLTKLDTGASPQEVYDAFLRVLVGAYGLVTTGGRVTPQARSVNVSFPTAQDEDPADAFSVDAVPAVVDAEHWAIPTKDLRQWSAANGRWVTTDPERLTKLTSDLNGAKDTPSVGSMCAYVPMVKLMRQTRSTHLGDTKPGGLYIELVTHEAWRDGISGDEWDTLFARTLRAVATRLAGAPYTPLCDPTLGTPISPAPSPEELANAANVFAELARMAEEAVSLDECQAALRWRRILGGNDRAEFVFPLPPGCDAKGNKISRIAPVTVAGPTGARGFA